MAIVLNDPDEARDRRMKMLLDTATTAMQIQNQRQELSQNAQKIALSDPAQNKYLRAEMATQNRSRMADAQFKEGMLSGQISPKTSPSMMNAKAKRTDDLINTLYENQSQREVIDDAFGSLERLTKGLGGKIERGFTKRLKADDPLLGDYQKVKMVLTNAQLRESLMLKGAISDVENRWLAEAAANDDLLSTPRATEVFNNILRKMEFLDKSKLASYKRNYGEDPSEWEEIKSLNLSKGANQLAKDAGIPKEILAQFQGKGKIKAIRLKESK